VNLRRLPKWKRPDREGGDAPWAGRWSALDREPTANRHLEQEESVLALVVARQWLARYGIVARDWWRRERPPIAWRPIYRELRRLELRGEVRRGYFVQGLAGAQFALPAAVEQLRAMSAAPEDAPLVIAASDPANVWSIPASGDSFARPRDARSLLVLRGGRVVLTSDARARSVAVRPGLDRPGVTAAVQALVRHVVGRRARDVVVERIDGQGATTSAHAPAFIDAGLRLTTAGLRFYTLL
jgi:ATP-dependent Lhr-like helicase